MRITQKDLEATVKRINIMFNLPETPYIYNEETKKHEPQAGVFLLDCAYGGNKLSRMSLNNGCTGQSDVTKSGYVTKRELYNEMQSIIETVYIMKEEVVA